MRQIHHYTMHTGDGRLTDRSEVSQEVIETLRPICQAGGGPLPGPWGWRLAITAGDRGGWLFTVYNRNDSPLVSCGLALDREAAGEVWPYLLDLARVGLGPVSERPPRVPWLSVAIHLGLGSCDRDSAAALADLERCLAWTLIELDQAENS